MLFTVTIQEIPKGQDNYKEDLTKKLELMNKTLVDLTLLLVRQVRSK